MKKSNFYWAYSIFAIVLVILFVSNYQFFANKRNEIFIGSLGLLTFTSIFYGFTISNGAKRLEDVFNHFLKERNKIFDQLKITDLKKEKNPSKKIEKIWGEVEQFDSLIDYLNMNKWLFMSILAYMISILMHLTSDAQWIVLIQQLSFWFGFYATIVIATTWFIVNHIYTTKIRK